MPKPHRRARRLLAVALVVGGLFGGARPEARAAALDKQQIRQVIRKHLEGVLRCYQAAKPVPREKLAVHFVVAGDGAVRLAERDPSSIMQSSKVEACVLAEVRSWRFPRSSDGKDTSVVYPFRFEWVED